MYDRPPTAMDDLLTVSRTRSIKDRQDETFAIRAPKKDPYTKTPKIVSADVVLNVLQSEPSLENLSSCLQWLVSNRLENSDFDIKLPSPKAARILNVLVNETIPTFWPVLQREAVNYPAERKLLFSCLSSVAGIGALATRLRGLASSSDISKEVSPGINRKQNNDLITDILELLGKILHGDKLLERIAKDIFSSKESQIQQKLIWKELVSWLAGGRLLSIAAEATLSKQGISGDSDGSWLGDGKAFAVWIGRNIRAINPRKFISPEECSNAKAQLFGRALSLGYPNQLVESAFAYVLSGRDELAHDRAFFLTLQPRERRATIQQIIQLASKHPKNDETALIKGLGALIRSFSANETPMLEFMTHWITGASGESIALDLSVHRAVIAALSSTPEYLERALKQMLARFGDKLYIQHTPVLHQEVQTQDILLLVGHIHRLKENWLIEMARSSLYINAISNRLAAPSSRSRYLGMVLGTSISELIDPVEKRMKFDLVELENGQGRQYRDLIYIFDVVGTLSDLRLNVGDQSNLSEKKLLPEKARAVPARPHTENSKIIAIEQIEEDSESEDDDLPVYAKPDSDEEDEEEDPTLIQRKRATPPVYIHDLIAGLRDYENYDPHQLALETASMLIRQKANFGTELSDHIEEVATQIAGLKDQFSMDGFQEMRLKAMISIIVAQPQKMGQWFSNALFTGDYSMSQRITILTSLSIAARELAGYREEDAALTGAKESLKDLFPSKRLTSEQEKRWGTEAVPVDALAHNLGQGMIRPMAVEAADKLSGPDILKVRTFSSRMEVEKKRKRPITNELARIVAENFFFPLTGRYRLELQIHGSSSVFNNSFLLSHFLKTLGLMLSASGSSTLSLPALTTEFWSLLLHLRSVTLNTSPVLEAQLFCFMTILEINDNDQRQMVQDHSKELLETKAWVQQVFDNARGGEEEGDKVRMLAAGVLVKCSEVVEKYQRLMLGDLVNYMP